MSPSSSSLWHVRGSSLRERFACRYGLLHTQGYFFPWHKHYWHRSQCEHGLSSPIARSNRLDRMLFDLPWIVAFGEEEVLQGMDSLDVFHVLRVDLVAFLDAVELAMEVRVLDLEVLLILFQLRVLDFQGIDVGPAFLLETLNQLIILDDQIEERVDFVGVIAFHVGGEALLQDFLWR